MVLVRGLVTAIYEFSTDVVLGKIIPHHGWGAWPLCESREFEEWSKTLPEEQAKVWDPIAMRKCGLEGTSADKVKEQLHMLAHGMPKEPRNLCETTR